MSGATPAPSPSAGPPAGNSSISSEDIAAIMAAQGGGGSSSKKPSIAFGGYGPLSSQRNINRAGEELGISPQKYTKSVQDYINEYYNWSDDQKLKLRYQLALLDKSALTATDSQLVGAWSDYVQQSANALAAGKALTPWDILAKDIAVRGEGGGSLAGTKTRTTTDTNLTSQADASAIFRTAAQSLLGRAPTTQEINQFRSALNAQERANPTTSTITTTTDEKGDVVNESRTSQGGISAAAAADMAQQNAKQNPEYGAYQAATTYHNAMMQMIMRGY